MEDTFDETNDSPRRIQRALNEAKKKELEEKFGAKFGETNNDLPPEIESQWLNNVQEFEIQFENAKRISVREYVGNPSFTPLNEIPEENLRGELNDVLKYLSDHNINVDFICEVPDKEAYRFVTEELMNHETDDIHIEGMTTNFIYEEFYPNDELDAKNFAEQFLWHLFERNLEYALGDFAKDEVCDHRGDRITMEQMQTRIEHFYSRFATFSFSKHEVIDCTVSDNYAVVCFNSNWNGLHAETMEQKIHRGESTLKMKKSQYGGFDVVQANVFGVEL